MQAIILLLAIYAVVAYWTEILTVVGIIIAAAITVFIICLIKESWQTKRENISKQTTNEVLKTLKPQQNHVDHTNGDNIRIDRAAAKLAEIANIKDEKTREEAFLNVDLGLSVIQPDMLNKANEYIREKMNIELPHNREKDAQAISDFLTGKASTLPGDILSAKVDGVNTFELAEKYKHDLPIMLRCCEEELKNMAATGNIAAPYYFQRAAILAKKQKDYELEIKICEILLMACKIYKEAHTKYGNLLLVSRVSIDEDMAKRLPVARKNLEKQQTGTSKRDKITVKPTSK